MPRNIALIVDDVPDLLQIMAEAVELALPDHAIATADSAHAAEALLHKLERQGDRVSVVVADQSLGGRTGLDLLADTAARTSPPGLLLVTGRANEQVERRAREIGARVLWKPFRLTTLVDAVRQAAVGAHAADARTA